MKPVMKQISDEEIRTFVASQRKIKDISLLAGNIRKQFKDRVLDDNGQIDEVFWSKLYEINAQQVVRYKSRYNRLLFRIIVVVAGLIIGICLMIYFWMQQS